MLHMIMMMLRTCAGGTCQGGTAARGAIVVTDEVVSVTSRRGRIGHRLLVLLPGWHGDGDQHGQWSVGLLSGCCLLRMMVMRLLLLHVGRRCCLVERESIGRNNERNISIR